MATRLKDHPENSAAGKKAKADAAAADAANAAQVQEYADADTAQGFRGVEVDQTPNENYTLAGVTAGLPTPETSATAAATAAEGRRAAEIAAAGVGER